MTRLAASRPLLERLLGPLPAVLEATVVGEDFGAAGEVLRVEVGGRAVVVKLSAPGKGGARELRFFDEVAPGLQNLPTFLGGEALGEGSVLVFEPVAGRQGDVLEGCDASDASAALQAIGRVHRDARVPEAWPRRGRFGEAFVQSVGPAVRAFVDETGGPSALLDIPGRALELDAILDAGPQGLIHADFHLDNLMFVPEPVLLDWQTAAVGPPEIDLTRFLLEGLTVDQRVAHGDEALRAWSAVVGRAPDPRRMRAAAERTFLYLARAYARPGFGEGLGSRAAPLRTACARRLLSLLG